MQLSELKTIFNNLWNQYTTDNQQALDIYNLFIQQGESVVNDHVAFRTFDDPRVNVVALGKFFEHLGYKSCGEYKFVVKKLYARHYEHATDPSQPKIFISELETKEFSPFLQQIATSCIDAIPESNLADVSLLSAGRLWNELDYDVYQKLLAESEYAAWLYVFGFRANHFTIFVNYLKHFPSIEAVNALLKKNNFVLNASGGEVKGTPAELLEQSSTMAQTVSIKFKQGTFEVLNSYYEFARRYPQSNGLLYQGFIAESADKIFESTNVNRR